MTEPMIDSQTIVQRASEPIFTRLDDDVIGLDVRSGTAHTLNATGARVWELIDEPTSVETICDRLLKEYDVEPANCRSQVITLLGDLNRAGLIEVRASLGDPDLPR